MAGSVLFASVLHIAVGGAFWLGGSLGEVQPARPVSNIIMVEVVSDSVGELTHDQPPPSLAVEAAKLSEPAEPEQIATQYEFQPQRVFITPSAPEIEANEQPELPVFEVPEKKPVPKPAMAETRPASLISQVESGPAPASASLVRQVSPDAASGQPGVDQPASTQVLYVHNPKPLYPHEARRRRQEGIVVLYVDVSPNGRVLSVLVKESSGHHLLDKAAQRAIRVWRFIPATRAGVAVRSTAEIPIRFFLSES